MLVHLCESLVEHNTVPDPKLYTPRSSMVSLGGEGYSSYVLGGSASRSPSNTTSDGSSHGTQPPPSSMSSMSTWSTRSQLGVRPQEVQPPDLRQEKRRIPSKPETSGSTSSSSGGKLADLSAPFRSPPENTISSSKANNDFMSIRPTTHLLRFGPKGNLQTIKGYILTNQGHSSVTALLNPKLPQNLISLTMVREFGLQIHPLEHDTDDFRIQLYDGPATGAAGRVSFKWSQGAFLDNAPFTVHCLVHDHEQISDLMFGKDFVDKRRHYWESNENRVDGSSSAV